MCFCGFVFVCFGVFVFLRVCIFETSSAMRGATLEMQETTSLRHSFDKKRYKKSTGLLVFDDLLKEMFPSRFWL